jgi:hypothetical protein
MMQLGKHARQAVLLSERRGCGGGALAPTCDRLYFIQDV